jgi:hypothetical protein
MPNAAMYHLGFRDYAQGVGRFTTVDPLMCHRFGMRQFPGSVLPLCDPDRPPALRIVTETPGAFVSDLSPLRGQACDSYGYVGNQPVLLTDPSGCLPHLVALAYVVYKWGSTLGCGIVSAYSIVEFLICIRRQGQLDDAIRDACVNGRRVYGPTADNPCPHWHRVYPSDEYCISAARGSMAGCAGILEPAGEACAVLLAAAVLAARAGQLLELVKRLLPGL